MSSNKKRAMTFAAVGAGVLTVAGIAVAASVTLTSSSLTAGTTVVAPCQSGTVTASYTSGDTDGTGFKVTAVKLDGLDTTVTGCAGKTIKVVLSDGSAAHLGSGSLAVPASGTTATVPLTTPVLESAATNLDIEID